MQKRLGKPARGGRLLFLGTLSLSSAHSGTKLEALRFLRASTDGLTLPSKRSTPPLCRSALKCYCKKTFPVAVHSKAGAVTPFRGNARGRDM